MTDSALEEARAKIAEYERRVVQADKAIGRTIGYDEHVWPTEFDPAAQSIDLRALESSDPEEAADFDKEDGCWKKPQIDFSEADKEVAKKAKNIDEP